MNHRTTLLLAGLAGLTGVALGAFGAHGLRDLLAERGSAKTWETAVHYHLLHAVGLFAVAAWQRAAPSVRGYAVSAAVAWTVGIGLFSGSLYALALGGPRWLGPVTPLGGVAFLVGWMAILAASFAKEE